MARCDDITEKQQIALFTTGLNPPLSVDVELHNPATLEDTMGLARAYERRVAISDDPARALPRPSASSRLASRPQMAAKKPSTPPAIRGAPAATPGAPTKPPFRRAASIGFRRRRWRAAAWTGSASIAQKSFPRSNARCGGSTIWRRQKKMTPRRPRTTSRKR
jgi:hypothetical protein